MGFDIRGQAGNGHKAIELMLELDPDVALMDIRMPVMDGVAATRKLSRHGARSRVLILTTYNADRSSRLARPLSHCSHLHLTRRLVEQHLRRPPP